MKQIDENYFKNSKPNTITSIDDTIEKGEQVLWRGKPKKIAYVFGSIFQLLPVALIWLIFDGSMIGMMIKHNVFAQMGAGMTIFMIVFFAFHLIPVWMWIFKAVTANREYKNLEYAFTNKRIIIKSGVIGIDIQNIYYSEIKSVNLKVGLWDKIFKVGDIYITSNDHSKVLFDICDPYFITQKLQEIVIDIKTDVEFPNALRPDENPGYNTKLKKDDK